MSDKKMMKVTLIRSFHGRLKKHQASVRGLGLRKLNHSVEVEDTAATRGMVSRVAYMVKVEDV